MEAKLQVVQKKILVMNLMTHYKLYPYWLNYSRITPVYLSSYYSPLNMKIPNYTNVGFDYLMMIHYLYIVKWIC